MAEEDNVAQWMPLIETIALSLIALAAVSVRAVLLRMTIRTTLRSLPPGTDTIDVQIEDRRGPSIRVKGWHTAPPADGT
jgi:hypothetical protein